MQVNCPVHHVQKWRTQGEQFAEHTGPKSFVLFQCELYKRPEECLLGIQKRRQVRTAISFKNYNPLVLD